MVRLTLVIIVSSGGHNVVVVVVVMASMGLSVMSLGVMGVMDVGGPRGVALCG